MGIGELLFVFVVAISTGFQAGQAGAKAESVSTGKICFDEEYQDRKKGCYLVVPPATAQPDKTLELVD